MAREPLTNSGWGMAILATSMFSISSPASRAAILSGMNPTTLLAARLLLATLLLASSARALPASGPSPDRRGLLICGLSGMARGSAMLAFNWSLSRIHASVATMCFSLYPSVVLVLLALRGEKLSWRSLIRAALGLGGTYLLIGPGGQVDLSGILLILFAACTYSLHLVMVQWFLGRYDVQRVTLYMMVSMSLSVTMLWAMQGAEWHDPGWGGWLAVFVLATMPSFLGQLLTYAAVRKIGSGQIALLFPFETLLTVTWSVWFLQEHLTVVQWVGSGLILVSTLLTTLRLRTAGRQLRWGPWSRWR